MANHPLYTNRLINEKSPYLLQHAHNPVDWYPWSEEAFTASKQSDKPIFLSIGYSTCHWCHVMEVESFEDLQVAQMMNETFINIKVDREELPEVDSLYMEFAQSMMAGAAGWPLNVILTPELQPFFAATYLPPVSRHGLMGLKELIVRIKEVWTGEEREKVLQQAEKIVEIFTENIHTQGDLFPEKEMIEEGIEILFKMADPVYGGIKGEPKFPIGYQSNLMLHYSKIMKEGRALFLVERTLDMMHRGGIYDHLGGGFSRYSVDETWLVPHFEKMLYDNALLIYAYLEAWQATKRHLYRQVAEEIIQYILRDMTHPEGGFFSAEDADSEGKEGWFYTWKLEEVQKILGKERSILFCEFYGITSEGNFEGRNILHTKLPLEEFVTLTESDKDGLESLLVEQKHILWKIREKRVHPLKDDKIISSWNGLMIYSLTEVGSALSEQRYLEAAVRAAKFIRSNMWKDGILFRRWRDGQAFFKGGLEEYSFLIRGLLSMFEAGLGNEWFTWAIEMTNILDEHFKAEDGAFYQTDGTDPHLILRKCQFSDGAEPSGNAVHCENLLRLYQITGNPIYLDQAEDIFKAAKNFIENYSPGYCFHLMNLNRYFDRHKPTIIVALNKNNQHFEKLRFQIYSHFIPHKAIIWKHEQDAALNELIPGLKNYVPIEGKTTFYLCHEGVCKKPVTQLSEMVDLINAL